MKKQKITQIELERQFAVQANVTYEESKRLIETLKSLITELVAKDKEVHLLGFCKFKKVLKKSRVGINPQNGAKMLIPAHYGVAITGLSHIKNVVKSRRPKASEMKTQTKKPVIRHGNLQIDPNYQRMVAKNF